jgi:hypothetical protein
LDLNLLLFEIRPWAIEGGAPTKRSVLSFSYAGVNRIRFKGIASVNCGNVSDPYQVTPKEGRYSNASICHLSSGKPIRGVNHENLVALLFLFLRWASAFVELHHIKKKLQPCAVGAFIELMLILD